MFKKLFTTIKVHARSERNLMVFAVVSTIVLTLWILHSGPVPVTPGESEEIGLTIPKGFLIVPLEITNARLIAQMIQHRGVVDVFLGKNKMPLAQNLRVLKLNGGDEITFGALVPEKSASVLQSWLSHPKLRAAVRTPHAGPTEFHIPNAKHILLEEISISEGL